MTLRVTTTGVFKPVNYKTPQSAIFEFTFATSITDDIQKFDSHIARNGFFSFKTGKGIVFIGRLTKRSEMDAASVYVFVVDNITLSRKLERFLRDQSSDVSSSQ